MALNIFQFFPFEHIGSFLDYIWNLILNNKIATITLTLALLTGAILCVWMIRETITWFLQTKKIVKQNQILVKQNQMLIDKINLMHTYLHNIKSSSPFVTQKTTIDEINEGFIATDDPFIEVKDQKTKERSSPKPPLDI